MQSAERRYQLIVFDWDGTLIDSAAGIAECIQEAARDLGIAQPSRQRASHVIGLGLHDSLRLAVPELPESRYAEFVARYRAHFMSREDEMSLFSGVRELLERLRGQGCQLAVATGKSRRGLERSLAASRLRACFDATRCGDETSPKPHPAMLLELMEELSVAPVHVLMVGDTSHDMEMARRAGIDALAVSYGAHSEAELRDVGTRGCVGSVVELEAWLQRHG